MATTHFAICQRTSAFDHPRKRGRRGVLRFESALGVQRVVRSDIFIYMIYLKTFVVAVVGLRGVSQNKDARWAAKITH